MRINGLSYTNNLSEQIKPGSTANKLPFSDFLREAFDTISEQESTNRVNNRSLMMGQMDNLHGIMIDAEKADLTLQFTMQIRNKLIEAYQEIMRLQL